MNAKDNALLVMDDTSHVIGQRDDRIGGILAGEGKLGAVDVEQVLQLQRAKGFRFGEAALRLGLITEDDLRRAVARQHGLPNLLYDSESISRELIVAHDPFHPRVEELRALRTQLLIRWSKMHIKRRMLAIVSPGAGEGRSYLAANLAVVFSQLGERTILIDADMRAPRQHRIFNLQNQVGLSTVLSGRAGRSAVVPVSESGTLSLLVAGACPPNPQELLLRTAFPTLLGELGTTFDVIIFDTPPAKFYADAQGLAFHAGSALVLARKDHTCLADMTSVIRKLGGTGAHIAGTVFNAF